MAQQLSLLVAHIAMTHCGLCFGAGEGGTEDEVIVTFEDALLLEPRFDTATAVACTECVGSNVVDFGTLEERQSAGRHRSFEHESGLDHAEIQFETRNSEIGNARQAQLRIGFSCAAATRI